MTLVFYSVSVSPYGAPTSMLNLIEGLARYPEFDVVVIVPKDGPLTERLKALNVRVLYVPHFKWIYKRKYYQNLKHRSKALAMAWLYKNTLEKVFLNLLYLPIHLWHVKRLRPDLIYVNASMGPMGIFVARILRVNALWHHREAVNDPDTDFYIEWARSIWGKVINWPMVRIYNSRFLEGMYNGLPIKPFPGKSYVIYNGVPAPKKANRREGKKIVFGMMGKVEKGMQKGQSEVLEIFVELGRNDTVLNIYGGGAPSYITSLKQKYPHEGIHFCGFKRPELAFPEMDFLIMNSRNESFGRVVAEAYSYGVPVLALRSGALPEIVDDGETGFVYDSLEQLKQLIQNSVNIRHTYRYQELSAAAKKKYTENFTIEKYTQNVVDVLLSMTK